MQETIGFNAKILIVVSIDKTFIAQHKKVVISCGITAM
jgi:hypothetical protein